VQRIARRPRLEEHSAMTLTRIALVGLTLAVSSAWSATRYDRWAAILEDAPVAETVSSREQLSSLPALDARRRIESRQAILAGALQSRRLPILGSTQTLLNAIYFTATASEAQAVRDLPGVVNVVRMRAYYRRADDRATQLVNAPAAWQTLGGVANAGAGRRIGILDSGIDHTHPAFQDSTLNPPAGFPRANRDSDLAFTNRKVIVARSYVDLLVLGDQPEISRPDDTSARDRVGHGTAAAMLAAGVRVDGPAATVSGVAPKAFLGSYKIFGSPGVNDVTFTNVIIRALEDAVVDGMDVVTLSLGRPADFGPLDDICGETGNRPCDPQAAAIDRAARLNVAVVVAAGNTGDTGFSLPTLGSIESPGTAPAAITVGATTNAHIYYQSLRVSGGPSELNRANIRFGDGPVPGGSITAPLRDVRSIGDDGKACRPLGNGTLNGSIAVLERGDCDRDVKVNNAQRAGAIAVVMIQFEGQNSVFSMTGLKGTGIPAVLLGRRDGDLLRSFLSSNPNREGVLDPAFIQTDAPADEIAIFSSQGPTIGDLAIKPELTAPGTDLYAATQNYDPNSGLFSSGRYTSVDGTSFAVPLVAGAAALVKQRNPSWNALQVKSALVNTANPDVTDFDSNNNRIQARVTGTGAGKLDANAALAVRVTADPATISFGALTTNPVALTRTLRLTNTTSTPITVNVQIVPRGNAPSARITVDQGSTISVAPGTTQLTVRLAGARPAAGSYEGFLVFTSNGVSIRVPYLYLVGDGAPHNIYPLSGNGFVSFPGADLDINSSPVLVKVLDQYGVPVAGANIRWSVVSGGGRIVAASARTDSYGVADAGVQMGPSLGEQVFRADVDGLSQLISGRTILLPTIRSNGVVDAASGRTNNGLAPGSYISIYGSGLSEVTRGFGTTYLPVSLANVSVSFDAPPQLSAPGRISFVSEGQINVQIPWEFQGLTNVQMKVSIGDLSSAVYNLRLNEFSPALFEYDDPASGRRMAAALDQEFRLVSGSNPIARGRALQLFVNGLGRVTSTPASGEQAPASPLSTTLTVPEVRIGGRTATVLFSGLAPGNIGLYQVNVVVPEDALTGVQPLEISAGGVTSQTSQIQIQ
jgi:minor extracellular serine protease Vpr